MIDYPDDQATQEQAEKHRIPEPMLIRDLVRIVEVINLEQKGFFGEEGGGLNRTDLLEMLRYEDEDLTIEPSELTPSQAASLATANKAAPLPDFYLPVCSNVCWYVVAGPLP